MKKLSLLSFFILIMFEGIGQTYQTLPATRHFKDVVWKQKSYLDSGSFYYLDDKKHIRIDSSWEKRKDTIPVYSEKNDEGYLNSLKSDTSYYIGAIEADTSWMMPVFDTVKVIMLVCDTSKASSYLVVYSKKGYARVQRYFYSPPIYLDEKKRRLSKNIIVWQAK